MRCRLPPPGSAVLQDLTCRAPPGAPPAAGSTTRMLFAIASSPPAILLRAIVCRKEGGGGGVGGSTQTLSAGSRMSEPAPQGWQRGRTRRSSKPADVAKAVALSLSCLVRLEKLLHIVAVERSAVPGALRLTPALCGRTSEIRRRHKGTYWKRVERRVKGSAREGGMEGKGGRDCKLATSDSPWLRVSPFGIGCVYEYALVGTGTRGLQ